MDVLKMLYMNKIHLFLHHMICTIALKIAKIILLKIPMYYPR